MEAARTDPEVLIPDEVIDDRFRTLFGHGNGGGADSGTFGSLPAPTRRQKFAGTLFIVVLVIAALGVASVVAVGAVIVGFVLFLVGLVARFVLAISGKTQRE